MGSWFSTAWDKKHVFSLEDEKRYCLVFSFGLGLKTGKVSIPWVRPALAVLWVSAYSSGWMNFCNGLSLETPLFTLLLSWYTSSFCYYLWVCCWPGRALICKWRSRITPFLHLPLYTYLCWPFIKIALRVTRPGGHIGLPKFPSWGGIANFLSPSSVSQDATTSLLWRETYFAAWGAQGMIYWQASDLRWS